MKRLYAIYDLASAMVIGGVHVFPNDAAATRFFSDLVGDPQTMMGRHPKDHQLRMLAQFDDETGDLLTEPQPCVVATGESIKSMIDALAAQGTN